WSGLEDRLAGDRHPDWRMLTAEGKPASIWHGWVPDDLFAWWMCPQSPFLEDWVSIQLREVIEMSDPDGFWVDGTWGAPCHCPRCLGRFGNGKPEGPEWNRYWAKVQFEFRDRFVKVLRKLKPTILVSFGNITARSEF